jgi:hypothetical protein
MHVYALVSVLTDVHWRGEANPPGIDVCSDGIWQTSRAAVRQDQASQGVHAFREPASC